MTCVKAFGSEKSGEKKKKVALKSACKHLSVFMFMLSLFLTNNNGTRTTFYVVINQLLDL